MKVVVIGSKHQLLLLFRRNRQNHLAVPLLSCQHRFAAYFHIGQHQALFAAIPFGSGRIKENQSP